MTDKKLPVADMTYREWLIGMALQGILASDSEGNLSAKKCATATIRYVDALLEEMESESPERKVSDIL
ncbi:MAG: hypothetical protein E6663_00020 [Staphylococcus lugdunensis]|nr:hypothetical protein [Staphylococcus lugdunensis]